MSLNAISVFHWDLVTYLTRMSSNSHLSCLTILRGEWRKEVGKVRRNVRVIGMVLTALLLFTALLPTLSSNWILFASPRFGAAIPARCFWPGSSLTTPNHSTFVMPETVLSYSFLTLSYVYQILLMFESTSSYVHRWSKTKPLITMGRLMQLANSSQARTLRLPRLKRTVSLILLYFYVLYFAIVETSGSFATSIAVCTFDLIRGSLQVFQSTLSTKHESERKLTFGQILALFMLILPILGMFETYWGKPMPSELLKLLIWER